MRTHYHWVVTSDDEHALGKAMQSVGVSHTKYFNRKYARTGTLWNERYDAYALEEEDYCYHCLRDEDLNPFRAGV